MIWYSHLLRIFHSFVLIHTVKGFCMVEAEVDVFWNSLAFFMIQQTLAICYLSYINLLFFFQYLFIFSELHLKFQASFKSFLNH